MELENSRADISFSIVEEKKQIQGVLVAESCVKVYF